MPIDTASELHLVQRGRPADAHQRRTVLTPGKAERRTAPALYERALPYAARDAALMIVRLRRFVQFHAHQRFAGEHG
jgi:hypothetical protein